MAAHLVRAQINCCSLREWLYVPVQHESGAMLVLLISCDQGLESVFLRLSFQKRIYIAGPTRTKRVYQSLFPLLTLRSRLKHPGCCVCLRTRSCIRGTEYGPITSAIHIWLVAGTDLNPGLVRYREKGFLMIDVALQQRGTLGATYETEPGHKPST